MSCNEDQNERCVTPLLDEKQCITDSTNGITNISSPDINLDDNLDKADSVNEEESHSSENKADQELISSSNNAINKSGSSGFDPIEGVSDISDEEDENLRSAEILDDDKEKCNRDTESSRVKSNSNGQPPFKSNKPSNFKKITKNTRERNYRDRMKKENFAPQNPDARGFRRMNDDRQPFNRYDKRREILRYNVRNVVAGRKNIPSRDVMNSRSRSRSFTPKRIRRSNSRSMSPGFRDAYRRRSRSPSYHRASPRPTRKAIPRASHSHSPSLSLSPPPPSQIYRSRSVSPAAYMKYMRPPRSQSRSRSRERMEKHYRRRSKSVRKKKKESKKRKRSPVRSRSPSRSGRLSPQSQISSRSLSLESERQIINNIEQSWSAKPSIGGKPTENIKVILKNADAITKKKSKKKRERKRDGKKKIKDPKLKSKSDKFALETPKVASKEVFASGDNILVSVSFNNKTTKEDDNLLSEGSSHKSKSKKQKVAVSPNSTLSFSGESDDEYDSKRRRKKKRKNKKERAPSESKPPETIVATSKRKSDMKPIAIIDLDKSPIKEIGSPKDVIILTDSDPENKMHQKLHQNKDLNVTVQEQSIQQKPICGTTPPASPPHTQPSAPSVQFSFQLKSKPQILPFNPAFTQEQDDDEEEAIKQQETKNNPPEPAEIPSLVNAEEKTKKSPDVYDPFEPTKSGSNSPVSTPPRTNDVTSSSDMMKESSSEIQKLTQENLQQKNIEDSLISSSIWTKKDFDKKPCTPPLPASPSPVLQASTQPQKSSNLTLYSPQALQQPNSDKIPGLSDGMDSAATQDMSMDLKSPYSPSSDDFNDMFEPPEPSPPPPNSTPSTFIDTSSVINLTGKGGISSFETVKLNVDYDSSKSSGVAGKSNYGNSSSFSFNKNNSSNEPKKALTLTASTLKTFNSQRSNVSQTNMFNKMGINYVNKNEMNIVENFLKSPAGLPMGSSGTITTTQTNSQQKAGRPASNFTRTKTSRFSKPPNDSNGSPVRAIRDSSYHHDSFRDIDDVPNSAVDLMVHDKWVKKINRQERVVEEVKLVLKPIYNKKQITKDEYKDILRRAVPKICHNRTGEINVQKIRSLILAYVKKVRYKRKIDSGKMHTTN